MTETCPPVPVDEPTPVGTVYCPVCGTPADSVRQCTVCLVILCHDCIIEHLLREHRADSEAALLDALACEMDAVDLREGKEAEDG